MPSTDKPDSTEPGSPDNSQVSEPVSEGSASANTSETIAQNQNISVRAATSSDTQSEAADTSVDQPDCLLDLLINVVSPIPPPPIIHETLQLPAGDTISTNDSPPSYNDLHAASTVDKSKPPRYKVAIQDDVPTESTAVEASEYSNVVGVSEDTSTSSCPSHQGNISEGHQPLLRIGLNLIRACKRLLDFLALVSLNPVLYSGHAVTNAIYRYEKFWLPLLNDYICSNNGTGAIIAPPLDIHWVWLVHMLAPQHYLPDCISVVGQMLPHRLLTMSKLPEARSRGKQLWQKMFPDQPYEQDLENITNIVPAHYQSSFQYNIVSAVGRQSAFYYQVSLSHYRRGPFLRAAIRRYRLFLRLKLKEPNAFLVPCYDMDLVWHSHQVHPTIYFNDTQAFLGCLLPHDDSVNDRSDGSKLVRSDKITRLLWQKAWGEEFKCEASMYRGDPPETYISESPPELETLAKMPIFEVSFAKVIIIGKFPEGPLTVKLRHELKQLGEITLKHVGNHSEHDITYKELRMTLYPHELKRWLVVKVAPQKRLGRLLNLLRNGRFWCMSDLEELHSAGTNSLVKKVLTEDDSTIELHMQVTRRVSDHWVVMRTFTGSFCTVHVPVVKLTAQTGMVVCQEHRTQRLVLQSSANDLSQESTTASAPLKQNIENQSVVTIDDISVENIINTGSLGSPAVKEKSEKQALSIVQLDSSPYPYRRVLATCNNSDCEKVQPTAPPLAEESDNNAPFSERSDSSDQVYDMFEVQMACHRLMNCSHPDTPQLLEVEVSHSRALMFSSVHVYASPAAPPGSLQVESSLLGDHTNSEEERLAATAADTSKKPASTSDVFDTADGDETKIQQLKYRTLVALAHTLDPNTLPSPRLLKLNDKNWQNEPTAMCDWDAGERAMIIKGKGGKDWAIIVGRWVGFRRGQPGSLMRRGRPGSSGTLQLRFYCPVNSAPAHIKLPYDSNKFDFTFKRFYVNQCTGTIQVASEETEFIENVTLALAINVLHVLCQPRMQPNPDEIDSVQLNETEDISPPTIPTSSLPNRIPVEKLLLLAAMGFNCLAAPTNFYRRQLSQKAGCSGAGITGREGRRFSQQMNDGLVCEYPLIAQFAAVSALQNNPEGDDGAVGACGACGGCGGCGGGVEAILGSRPQYLWGNSQAGDDGGGIDAGAVGGGFEGGEDFALPFSILAGGGGSSATEGHLFSFLTESGGGGGEMTTHTDGGACGSCGGCGGCAGCIA